MEKRKGKFIVIEGLDGAGTTTQVKKLSNYLYEASKKNLILCSREPTMLTEAGLEIRRRLKGELLEGEIKTDDFLYWANLFLTDRKWHLKEVIKPLIDKGIIVISDRHMLSTIAYQSSQGGQIKQLIDMHEGLLEADLTLFLKVDADVALNRIKADRQGGLEYFENNLPRVAKNYNEAIEKLKDKNKQNIVIIDGEMSKEDVSLAIQNEVNKIFFS